MALLIYGLDRQIGNAQAWRDTFAELVPGLEVRIFPEIGDAADIEYLAFMRPDFDAIPALPKLKAMFSRSAGVEAFIDHPKLPQVPLGKIEPSGGDPMMTEYTVMHVLRFHREMPKYQRRRPIANGCAGRSCGPETRRIGFLGLGLMAKAPALVLKSLGFPVSAWVRSPRAGEEIPIFPGADQFEPFMDQTDIAVCLLPLTRETEGILCARTFAMMPRGRDGHQHRPRQARRRSRSDRGARFRAALLRRARRAETRAAAAGKPAMAASESDRDAACRAPPDRAQLVAEIAANIRSVEAGGGLLQEIDKKIGY